MNKSRYINYGLVKVLFDGKVHTIAEMADRLEVCYKTISRHLIDLSYYYPINTYVGGRNSGGVQLDKSYFEKLQLLSLDEFLQINTALEMLKDYGFDFPVLSKKISGIIKKLEPHADTTAKTSERSSHDRDKNIVR